MLERFTDNARKVMALANQEAQRLNHEWIGPEHVLFGIIKLNRGVGMDVLKNLKVDRATIYSALEKLVKSGPHMVTMGKLPQTPVAKKVIEAAIEEARALNHNYVGTEHLLLALIRVPESVAHDVLRDYGLQLESTRSAVIEILGSSVETTTEPPRPTELGKLMQLLQKAGLPTDPKQVLGMIYHFSVEHYNAVGTVTSFDTLNDVGRLSLGITTKKCRSDTINALIFDGEDWGLDVTAVVLRGTVKWL